MGSVTEDRKVIDTAKLKAFYYSKKRHGLYAYNTKSIIIVHDFVMGKIKTLKYCT